MIIDSSALIAILQNEEEAPIFLKMLISTQDQKYISAANFLETAIIVDSKRNPIASRKFDDLLTKTAIEIEPVTASQAKIAREAYRDFGKGSGHPAKLNFGDCFAYALAKEKGEALLYKGNDFIKTDIKPA